MRALLVSAHNPSAWTGPTGNNTYLFTGAVPTLIDAGVGNEAHIAEVAWALEGRPLSQVLITHGHHDHVAGVEALRARWPGVRLLKMLPAGQEGMEPIGDGDRVPAGDSVLDVVATPGHSPDHCCFVDRESTDVCCGDLVRAGGTIVIAASRGGSLRDYLASLERIRSMRPRALMPGHGPEIEDPSSLIDAYVLHRTNREKQIVSALRDGLEDVADISARIYPDIDSALHAAAVDTVLAHLIKLEEDGRAERAGGRWRLTTNS